MLEMMMFLQAAVDVAVPATEAAAEVVATAPSITEAAARAITLVTPVVVPFITFGFRRLMPKIPRIGVPFVAMGIGAALSALTSYAAGNEFTPLIGAGLGLAGVGLREMANTWREHGSSA